MLMMAMVMTVASHTQAEYVVSGERLEAKVLRQLKRALQPVLKQPVIEYAEGEGVVVQARTPDPLPAVFDGERIIAYAFFNTTDTVLYVFHHLLPNHPCALCFHVM
jgi:hypothetical protein